MKKPSEKILSEYAQNLSHELLTPLAVIRSRAELIMQSPNLNEADLKNLDAILKTVDRMSRLNKALILLSKIDNRIYRDTSDLDVNEVVTDSLEKFEDQIRIKSLRIRFQKSENKLLKTNPTLFEILVTNIIKNAVFHNLQDGQINIYSGADRFEVENDTDDQVGDEIFDRFMTKGKDENSLGLGLHIVKKICALFKYNISYTMTDQKFKISIFFSN